MTPTLTDEQVVRVLAEREGAEIVMFKFHPPHRKTSGISCVPFEYLTSRDALAPVLEGLSDEEWRALYLKVWQHDDLIGNVKHLLTIDAKALAYAIAEVITK